MGPAPASPGSWLPSWKPGPAQGSGEAPGQTLALEVPGGWGRAWDDWAANTSAHRGPRTVFTHVAPLCELRQGIPSSWQTQTQAGPMLAGEAGTRFQEVP